MKKIIAVVAFSFLLMAATVWSYSKAQCIYECQKSGGGYGYCKQVCGG